MISFFDVETKVLELDPKEVDVPVFSGRGSEVRLVLVYEVLKYFYYLSSNGAVCSSLRAHVRAAKWDKTVRFQLHGCYSSILKQIN